MTGTFSILDGIILFTYLVVVLSMGFYYSRRQDKDTVSYFLAGRSMGWFTIGLSIFATNISSEHFIGLAGSGASRGLAVGHFELMAIFILIVLGWFITPLYMRSGVQTIPEFLGKRFDEKSRKFFAGLSIFLYIFTKVTVTLFAGGILFYKLFGINIYASAIIIVLITGIYTVIGGETSVMKTHVIQAVMMILGAVLMTGFGLAEVGGMHALKQKLPVDFFTLFKPMSDPDYPWTGIIFGAPIIAFWYWCTDQYIVQRILSARNIQEARKGSLLAAFLKLTPMFILVLPGLIAIALFPEIKGDDAYPMLLLSNIIPTGIKGLILTGVVAAIMSSLASVFNSTSAIFTNDFYKPKFPEASEAKLVL
ncbi:MAG: sodium:solute symporter family transporter, partial [Syntrophothermus sp.]